MGYNESDEINSVEVGGRGRWLSRDSITTAPGAYNNYHEWIP